MVSTFTTNFGIEEMATGDQSGAWGTTTNFNLDIVDRITAYGTVALSGTTHTLTVRAASPSSGSSNVQDGMYRVLDFTGALGAANTVTIGPNTTKAFFIVINSTTDSGSSGPYSVIFSQGSGANFTLANGKSAIIYCDGAGSGAAVAGALPDPSFTTLDVTGATTLGSTLAVTGAITGSAGGTLTKEDSGTNTVLTPVTVKRTSSGTPAAGIGAA